VCIYKTKVIEGSEANNGRQRREGCKGRKEANSEGSHSNERRQRSEGSKDRQVGRKEVKESIH
jgi:hypothetical protein